MSSIKSGITISTSIEMVPDKGWKNVFIKGLKVASSWERPVQEDHDPSTLPDQLNTFSLDERKSQTRPNSQKNDTQVLEAGSSKASTKKDNARQAAKAVASGPTGDLPQGIGFSVFSVDEQPSNSIHGHSGPMELDKQAPGIGSFRKGDDQSARVDGIAPSASWDVDPVQVFHTPILGITWLKGGILILSLKANGYHFLVENLQRRQTRLIR